MCLFSCLTDDEHPLLVALEVGLRSGISVAMGLGKSLLLGQLVFVRKFNIAPVTDLR